VVDYAAYLASILKERDLRQSDITITPVARHGNLDARYRGTDPALKPIVHARPHDVRVV
jgi:hypothetical protein